MFCIHCGEKILEDNKFCTACGKPVDKVNPNEEPSTKDLGSVAPDNKLLQFASKTEDFLTEKILPTIKRTSKSAIDKGRELTSEANKKIREDVIPKTESVIESYKDKNGENLENEEQFNSIFGRDYFPTDENNDVLDYYGIQRYGSVEAYNAKQYESKASGLWGLKSKHILYFIWGSIFIFVIIIYLITSSIISNYYSGFPLKFTFLYLAGLFIQLYIDLTLHKFSYRAAVKRISKFENDVEDRIFSGFIKDKIILSVAIGLRGIWLLTGLLFVNILQEVPLMKQLVIEGITMFLVTAISTKSIVLYILKPINLYPEYKKRFANTYMDYYVFSQIGINLVIGIIILFSLRSYIF